MLCCSDARTLQIHQRYGCSFRSSQQSEGLGYDTRFSHFFHSKNLKTSSEKLGHDDQISKNKLYDNIAIQKSMTSFDLHGLMRPGLIKVTYAHPPLVPFASARWGGPNFE